MIPLERSSRAVLKNCLDIKPKESLMIVVDKALGDIGDTIWKTAAKLARNVVLLKFANGNERKFPPLVEQSLAHANACLVITSTAIDQAIFTKARHAGARLAVLQNANRTLVERCFATNYKSICNLSRKLSDLFSIGKSLQLTTPSGTAATITISRVKGIAETGMAHQAGEFTFLPAGEACIILNHKHIDGRVTIDRLAGDRKKLDTPITLNVKDGEITQIRGATEADDLKKKLRKFGKTGRQIHEFGVGTNQSIRLGTSRQEDEKTLGTTHISFGQNTVTKVHGKMNQAVKGIMLKPTLSVDGRPILQDGKIVA